MLSLLRTWFREMIIIVHYSVVIIVPVKKQLAVAGNQIKISQHTSSHKAYDLGGIIVACFGFTINYTGGIMKIRLWHYANSHYLNLTLALFSNALYYPAMAL